MIPTAVYVDRTLCFSKGMKDVARALSTCAWCIKMNTDTYRVLDLVSRYDCEYFVTNIDKFLHASGVRFSPVRACVIWFKSDARSKDGSVDLCRRVPGMCLILIVDYNGQRLIYARLNGKLH